MLPLLKKMFEDIGIALGEMDPNGFFHINVFQYRCLAVRVEPRSSLFWYHYDFRHNPKSNGFYTIARRSNWPDWAQTNSNNKGSHEKWFFVSGMKVDKLSVWRAVDLLKVVMPSIIGADSEDHQRLYEAGRDRIPVTVSRNDAWLVALWVSTREAIVARKQVKFLQQQQQYQAGGSGSKLRLTDRERSEDREQISPPSPTASNAERQPLPPPGASGNKMQRQDNDVIKTYAPQWGVLSSDSIIKLAPKAAKEVSPDLCRGLILPEDRHTYDEVDPAEACTEMLPLLSMDVPWAATVADKMKDMQFQTRKVKDLEVRAARAEESLRNANMENECLNGQASVLKADRERLEVEVATLRGRLQRRNGQLKAARKVDRKNKKLLELTEDRCFQMGFNDAVMRAHSAGLDHKLLLAEGESDPVGREESLDEVPEVYSGEDEALSE